MHALGGTGHQFANEGWATKKNLLRDGEYTWGQKTLWCHLTGTVDSVTININIKEGNVGHEALDMATARPAVFDTRMLRCLALSRNLLRRNMAESAQ